VRTGTTAAGGSRVFRLGSRYRRLLTACFIVFVVAGIAGYWAESLTSHAAVPASDNKYGGLPSWLPKAKVPVGRVLQASSARPQLGIEGDTFVVHVGGAQVTATAVGPQVPSEGQFPVASTTPCTFDITIAKATGTIALRQQDFTTVDEFGDLHTLLVTLHGGGRMPASIRPGQTVTLALTAVLPTGNGTLRWSPGSSKPIASWDFAVEID
jgi:hypothetical protein